MEVALLVARLLLALVFVVAGVAKLADRTGSRQAIVDFGVPTPLASPLGILLPLAELAVAAALIPAFSAWWGALGALALLFLFVAGIGANLARGRKPDCHCFGQLYSEPAGWKTLVRNGALGVVAGFVVWQGQDAAGPSAVGWLTGLSAAQVVNLLAGLVVLGMLAGQWWILLNLLKQNGRLMARLEALEEGSPEHSHGLPVGEAAPNFELTDLDGERRTLEALRAPERPVMLLFTDPNCGPCTAMLPSVGRWQEEHSGTLTVALVSRGDPDDNAAKASEHGLANVLLQEDWELSEAYGVTGTPSAVLVRPDGMIGSRVLEGEAQISDLLNSTVGEAAHKSYM